MAVNTQIDSLIIDIKVQDGKGKGNSTHKITELDKALNSFQNTVKKLDITGFKSKVASMTSALKPFVNKLKEAQNSLKQLNALSKFVSSVKKAGGSTGTKVGKTKVSTGEAGEGTTPAAQEGASQILDLTKNNRVSSVDSLAKSFGKLRKQVTDADGKTTLFFEKFEKDNKITQKFTAELDKNGEVIKETLKEVNTTADNVSGEGLKSFFLSIKRIALYRAIRTSLRIIVKMFKEGIANVAAFDETTRHAMSEISSSFTVIKNSIGVIFKPLIELIAPFIRTLARQIGEVANAISYLTAKLRGQSKWLKVNTEYFEEINKQSHLLDFDQFSVLSNMDQTSGMFSMENVDESEISSILGDANALAAVLAGIATTLTIIGATKIITWFISGKLLTGIKSLTTSLLTFSGTVQGLAVGIGVLVAGLVYFISSMDQMSDTAKWLIPTLAILAATLTGLAVAHAAAKAGLAAPVMAGITAAAIAAGITLAAGTAIAVSKHADGGMFEGQGTMYHLAGESGAEIVAHGSRGTGVVNTNQFTVAMVNALVEYGAAQKNTENVPIVIQLDGKEVARMQVRNNANELMRNYNIELKPR